MVLTVGFMPLRVVFISWAKNKPINAFFRQGKLRSHLLHCLTADKMTHFTMLQPATKIYFATTVTINVFCSYRMPCKKSENNIYEQQMVECSDGSKWFSQNVQTNPRCCVLQKKLKMRLVVLSVLAEKSWNYMYLNNMRSYIKFNFFAKKNLRAFYKIYRNNGFTWIYFKFQILGFQKERETSCLDKWFFVKIASGLVNCENNNINISENGSFCLPSQKEV